MNLRNLLLLVCVLSALNGLAEEAPATVSPQQSLQRLLEGNLRFIEGRSKHPHDSQAWRQHLTREQHPFATILGCSDSRVPIEMIFDEGFGDLFVIRVAGNIVDVGSAGSVEYGILHLGTNVVLVMGHEGCGAVTAALEHPEHEAIPIRLLLKNIQSALRPIYDLPADQRVRAGVEANVRQSVDELSSVPGIAQAISEGRLLLVGAVYELETGRVRVLGDRVSR